MRRRRPERSRGDKPARGTDGPSVVVGRRPALEAVRSGRAVEILLAEGIRSTPALREVVEAAGVAGVRVETVPADRIESLAEGTLHQGVAARVRPPAVLTESDLGSREWSEEAIVLLLDGVVDPQNLGAIARTAEAAGAEMLVTTRRRSAPLGAAALKSSAGALLHLPVALVPNLPRAIRRLQDAGFWAVGLDGDASSTIHDERPPGRLALVLGAEGEGLSRLVRATCDDLIAIPQRGRVGSLNVSVAAGVALFSYALPGKAERGT